MHEVHEALKEMGEYALYVFTNYGIFIGDNLYNRGAQSIYQLLKLHDFDGCDSFSDKLNSAMGLYSEKQQLSYVIDASVE